MRILLVIDHLGIGGAQRQMVNLANELVDQPNCSVYLFFYHSSYMHFLSKLDRRINICAYQKKSKLDFFVVYKLVEIVKKEGIDVVLSYLKTPSIYNEIAGIFHSAKVIVSERSTYKNPNLINLGTRVRNQLHRLAHLVICNSQYHANLIKFHAPFLRRKVQVVYNYVDKDFFEAYSLRAFDVQNSFLCVGAINSNKNPLLLIRALHLLKTEYNIEASVSWAGEIRDQLSDKKYKQECDQLISAYGLESNWTWLGKVDNVSKLHLNYSFLILPSFYEGLPNAICEGMASGLICLASNVCENPLLLKPLDSKFLFSPFDPNELAGLMFEVLNFEAKELESLSRKLHKRALNLFTRNTITQSHLQLTQ